MDQGQLSSLDPKLREAYERVMSSSAPAQSQPPAAPPTLSDAKPVVPATPAPAVPTPPVVAPPPSPSQPGHDPLDAMNHASTRFAGPVAEAPAQPVSPAPQEAASVHPVTPAPTPVQPAPPPAPATQPPPAARVNQTVASEQMHAYVADEVAGVKQSLKFIQIMYIVGGAVFFIVYALFWMKFFNIATPF